METSTRIMPQALLSNIWLCFIDYYFICFVVGQKCKNNTAGKSHHDTWQCLQGEIL